LCTPFFKKARPLVLQKIIAVDHNPRPFLGYPLKKKLEKELKGFLYGKYIDTFIGVSEYTVNELINDFGSRISKRTRCIYNGILTQEIRVRMERNLIKPSFVVVSHLRESKGIQDLIEAVSLLDETIKQELRITVFGSGPYESHLLDLCERLSVTSNFDFRGNSASIKNQLADYDYLLQPTHMECFSLSILESLAANVPVITTPVGGNEEAVQNQVNGLILPVANPIIWANKLTLLWKGELTIVGDISKSIRHKYDVKRMVNNYENLLYSP
jgi:glycosyltransferase involved in cell wall biosynthesis